MLDGRIYPQLAHLGGLLGDGGRQLAILDGLHRVVNGVEADEDDVLGTASRFRSLDSAEDHLVVVSEDAVNLRLGLQDVLEDAEALRAVEVGGLAGDDLDVGVVGHHLVEALAPVAGGGCSGDALQLDDLALATEELGQVLTGHLAPGDVVRGDVGDDLATGSGAVNGEDRDARRISFLHTGHHGVGIGGVDQQGIHLFLDEVLDVGGLFGRIILGVHDDELDAQLGGLLLRSFFQGDEEGIVQRRER